MNLVYSLWAIAISNLPILDQRRDIDRSLMSYHNFLTRLTTTRYDDLP